jgi:hypothetical protein
MFLDILKALHMERQKGMVHSYIENNLSATISIISTRDLKE